MQAPKYQSAAERAKLAAEQAAAEEARRKAASDDATERALKQVMSPSCPSAGCNIHQHVLDTSTS